MDYEYEELSYNLNKISFGEAVPILAANHCPQLSLLFYTSPTHPLGLFCLRDCPCTSIRHFLQISPLYNQLPAAYCCCHDHNFTRTVPCEIPTIEGRLVSKPCSMLLLYWDVKHIALCATI